MKFPTVKFATSTPTVDNISDNIPDSLPTELFLGSSLPIVGFLLLILLLA